MKIFDGKKAARKILRELGGEIKAKEIAPALAVILVGDDEASKLYVKLKKEAAAKVGIKVNEFYFSNQAPPDEIIKKIKDLNQDIKINGIIIQLPLSAIFNTEKIIETIDPQKDVDGFHKENRRLLEKGQPYFLPVLPLAILTALADALDGDLAGKEILAMVNSEVFGQTLKLVLQREGADKVQFMVRNTCLVFGIEKEILSADALITACGCPNLIKGEMIKAGAALIDAGITRYHDGKVVGDVDRKGVTAKAGFLTPVPGGIGPLTVALLLRNVYLAALQQNKI